ncbi:TPA: transcription termination factor NusA [Candidatus Collierbacteria bacterium]|uniref:Transcription termination/antitermination protein NusA n=1 Tax=Candidatus Collierbacteria bacterium GW2011_GWA2_42_17 TaxID=1618378 RepID=A0A0G0Z3P6_9BACT|nr:MAG: NusA antitermination factor [Candidatus Collierbacteria bacterium GW2011_GWB2_42_12]KKS43384.1 MAG: NusA antitermination factor [Candidatus Collierbacteria bacterium GW2011_GWA2_42_17]KKS62292.1 MAG: NusA antitermination factor [Candidatus Collierbacteria bacterium GW2011_GWD2_42_50]KKS62684.1 MAG: NusA antitermination factor [Candidatus Collierbacteria bacterium GW2011_GWE2_42_48]KKS63151.1 MAG: NusA antitermination factor [Candidatus Collierbacteria bacterium GW2011_GWF1_42_50]KKS649
MDTQTLSARTEFAAAINQICSERGIAPETVLAAINTALIASFKKDYPEQSEKLEEEGKIITADVDSDNGQFRLFVGEEGGKKKDLKEITPPGFGRIAAQAAKQVILQTIREAERDSVLADYQDHIGEVMTGMVQRMDGRNVVIDLGRGQAVMPPEEQSPTEFYRLNSRLSVYLKEIADTVKGRQIIVSRADDRLLSGLFQREVPEVSAGSVIIKGVAREPGSRSKVSVESTQPGVDPVGSCVGQKGVRVQAVINELNNEKIDIIQYSEDKDKYIKAALAPAEGLDISYDKNTGETIVTVPSDQLSLAIGRGGQNVKLAAKLTQTKLRIISDETKDIQTGIVATGTEEFEIDQLGLDTKTRNLLVEAELTHIEDLTSDKLDSVKGLGPKTLEKIKAQLAVYKN